jgi:hypothetical protein
MISNNPSYYFPGINFNNSYYTSNNTIGITQAQADLLYLHKNGGSDTSSTLTGFSNDLTFTGNINVNNKSISPIELSQLDGINTNQSIQQQINGISGGNTLLTSNNIWLGTQQFNNNILVNGGTVISPTELSYIDGASSNLQNQLTTNSNNISTINSTLSNNGITNSTNVISSIDQLQTQINNLPNSGVGSGTTYYFTSATNTNNNQYLTISKTSPNGTNQILQQTINNTNGNVLLGQFMSDSALNLTSIPNGIWDFNFYANDSANAGVSTIYIEGWSYDSGALGTKLFTINGGDINSLNVIPYNLSSTENLFNITLTTYLVIRIYCNTTNTNNTTIYLDYNSSTNYSHFHIPIVINPNHNDTLNIQGGQANQYYHLTQAQYNNYDISSSLTGLLNNKQNTLSNANSTTSGILTSTDWNTFNNKAPTTTANTTTTGLLTSTDWNTFNNKAPTTTANTTTTGLLTSTDWNTFNNKQNALSNANTTTSGILTSTDWNTFNNKAPTTTANTTTTGLLTSTDWNTFNNKASTTQANSTTTGLLTSTDWNTFNNKSNSQAKHGKIFVSSLSGSNSNDGLSLINAVQTITQALTNLYISSGYQVEIEPGTYVENLTISAQNTTITAPNSEISSLVNINGNITITATTSSVRLVGLSFTNLIISGNCNVYLKNCQIANLTKSGTGYLSIDDCIFQNTSVLTITGSGNCNLMNGSQLGAQLVVNNAAAIVVVMNCQYVSNITLTSGILSIINTVVYSTNSSFNAVSSASGSYCYLSNLSLVNANDNSNAKVSLLGFWSIDDVIFNKTSSTLTGTNLARNFYQDGLNLINNLVIGGNINNTTSTQLSYLNNTSSDIQTQLNNKAGLSTSNTFTNINEFQNYLKLTGFLQVAGYNIGPTVLSYLDGLTSNVQTQLNNKASLSSANNWTNTNTFNSPLIQNIYGTGLGNYNTSVNGLFSLTSGSQDTSFGYGSLNALTSGPNNTGIGYYSLNKLTTGSNNCALGVQTLANDTTSQNNIAIGGAAGLNNQNGNNNIYIGTSADNNIVGNVSQSVAIGYNSKISNSNEIVFGTSSETVKIPGTLGGTNLTINPTNIIIGSSSYTPTQLNNALSNKKWTSTSGTTLTVNNLTFGVDSSYYITVTYFTTKVISSNFKNWYSTNLQAVTGQITCTASTPTRIGNGTLGTGVIEEGQFYDGTALYRWVFIGGALPSSTIMYVEQLI